jgi:hypothetical protein
MPPTSRPRSQRRKNQAETPIKDHPPGPANVLLRALQHNLLPRWLPHADWSTALLYLLVFWALDLPSILISYDHIHQTNLLMSSLRILQGQVPYLDFYPWYGPLFHYFAAGWVWLLGGNLLAVKLFIKVISPLLSLAMLIAALRMFRLEAQARFFAVAASIWWIFEGFFLLASTRTFLGIFLIGLWITIIRKQQHPWARILIFPSSLLAFLYSPEIGLYLQAVILTIVLFDLIGLPAPLRKTSFLAHGAGALITVVLVAAGSLSFKWFGNYLHFFLYTSSNMIWAYSLPLPELGEFVSSPRQWLHFLPGTDYSLAGSKAASSGKLLFFLPLPVLLIASGWILIAVRRGKSSSIPVWIPACVVYGVMLWTTTFLRMDGGHLLWALPPIMILLGKLFSRPTPWAGVKIGLLALLLWGWSFFFYAPPQTIYWKSLGQQVKIWFNWTKFSGVLESPAERQTFDNLQAFIQTHPQDQVLFPLHSYDAYRLGQPWLLPFDDLFWANFPERKEKLLNLMQRLNAAYVCLDANYLFYAVYVQEDINPLLDFIATHYQPLQVFQSAILYQRLPEPRVLAQPIQSLPGPISLSNQNRFRTEWELPDGFSGGYIEINESFSYASHWFQRFSRPLVKVLLNDQPINRPIEDGSARIRNTSEGGIYRIYVPRHTSKVTFQILYPGILNLKPNAVTLRDIGFYQFNFRPDVPYTASFLKDGY